MFEKIKELLIEELSIDAESITMEAELENDLGRRITLRVKKYRFILYAKDESIYLSFKTFITFKRARTYLFFNVRRK